MKFTTRPSNDKPRDADRTTWVRGLSIFFRSVAITGAVLGGTIGALANVVPHKPNAVPHTDVQPASTEMGFPDSRVAIQDFVANADAPGLQALAYVRAHSTTQNEVLLLSKMHRDHADVMANYYEALAERVKTQCASGNIDLCPPALKSAVMGTFFGYAGSNAFTSWREERMNRFTAQLDPAFVNRASEAWPTLSRSEKIGIIQTLVNQEAAAFSEGAFQLKPPQVIESDLPVTTVALYDPETHRIEMTNFHLDHMSFRDIVTTQGHEVEHAGIQVMFNMLESEKGRAYLQAHGLMNDARILHVAMGELLIAYGSGRGVIGPGHDLNPNEKMAYTGGAYVVAGANRFLPKTDTPRGMPVPLV